MRRRALLRGRAAVLVLAATTAVAALLPDVRLRAVRSAGATVQSSPSPEQLRRQAFELAYNLDHEEAIALLRQAVAAAPDDAASHRALASILWLHMLFLRGAVTVDHYLGSFSRARVELKQPPEELVGAFRHHAERARGLAERKIAANPRDAQAHYDLGAALGLQASYIATVEGRMLAGFRAARRSFDLHERVMELDPARADAGLVVGTYRYIVSTLSLPMRMMAYVAGFGGGRDKGIEMLRATAASDTEARTDAMFALILVYNREKRYDEALQVIADLRRLYPRNRLVVLEAGSTAIRAGKGAQAEALLTEGLAMTARDPRRKIPGEEALWRYKRGAARVLMNNTGQALEDLRLAVVPDAQAWVAGRARVEIGRLALRQGNPAQAIAEARQAQALCQQGNDPECVAQARQLLSTSSRN